VTFLRTRTARFTIAAAAVVGLGVGTTAAVGAITGPHGDFAVTDLFLPGVPAGGTVSQSVAGLWFGGDAGSFHKVAGASWLKVDDAGLVTGTVPAGTTEPATVTVGAGDHTVTLDVPVLGTGQQPRLQVASWNLDDAGSRVSEAVRKEVRAIAANNIQVLGLQETNGVAATELARDLGWYSYQSSGDLGIVSAFPISNVTAPTASVPAAGVTLDVRGHAVRVWTAHLDETAYAPYAACLTQPAPSAAALVTAERGSTRYTQAQAVAAAIKADVDAAATTPVVLLGDLASPAASDWTSATASTHCGTGPVAWPVPATFTAAGLVDSYRAVKSDPVTSPGFTWSPLTKTHAGGGTTEPQDRIDYVYYAGGLRVLGAESLSTGWVGSRSGDVVSDWTSDHAAAVTLFQLTAAGSAGSSLGSSLESSLGSSLDPSAGTAAPSTSLLVGTTPRIAGAAKRGTRLRVSLGAWSPQPVFSYQWYVAGKPVRGATRATFKVTKRYQGKRITVQVTGSKSGYRTVTLTSPAKRAAR
jgi:endonuclease/exonuclease/phosphatase family metal-dependent hydrolase